MNTQIELIRQQIIQHDTNAALHELGYEPLFAASPSAKVIIIGQAPGIKAQQSGLPWNDASGIRLMQWLGIDERTFRDEQLIAHIPMDFYYPGKGISGDLPPRKEFAELWHPQLFELMPQVEMTILIGSYAQKYYLKGRTAKTLTETVQAFEDYLPEYFPLVHPSPLNFRWFAKNPWFENDVVPVLQGRISKILSRSR